MSDKNEEKLKRLLTAMSDKSLTEDSFVEAFNMVLDHIASFQDATVGDLAKIFDRLDEFSNQLKTDNESERSQVKQMVGAAIADLRIKLDARFAEKEIAVEKRLSEFKDGKDADEVLIIQKVLSQIPPPPVIPETILDTPDQIIGKINQSELTINTERVTGLVDYIRMAAQNAASSMPVTTAFYNGLRGKNLTIVGGTAKQVGDTVQVTVSGAGGGQVNSVVAGTGISVDSTDPANPIVTATGGGTGTVTTVSVVSANGFAGSVANATTTPAITLTTSITGILKGNGTAISAASAGTDYEVPLTFSTGLTRSTNTITVNTSQNIATLSNLTSNGLVTTSGGGGTLGVTVPGTGVLTALAVNVGSAGAFVTFNGALGTPSSGTVTNLTGTASININGTVGATTPSTGVFTTLVAGSTTSLLLGTAGSAVGNIGFRNGTSGTITLAPVTGALGTVTLTLPAATDTVAVLAASQTLSNKTIASASLTGTQLLAEGASIGLDPSGSADGAYSGITTTATAGYTQAFGDLVYLAVADSRWELADADAAATAGPVALAMVVVAGTDGNACTLLLQGRIRADAKFPTMTVGATQYVGETAGEVQGAIPTGADSVIRTVGYSLTADELYFNPSTDWQISVA